MKYNGLDYFFHHTVILGKTNYSELLEQSKVFEQEQLKEACNDGYKKANQDIVTNSFSTFEQYQNEKNG